MAADRPEVSSAKSRDPADVAVITTVRELKGLCPSPREPQGSVVRTVQTTEKQKVQERKVT